MSSDHTGRNNHRALRRIFNIRCEALITPDQVVLASRKSLLAAAGRGRCQTASNPLIVMASIAADDTRNWIGAETIRYLINPLSLKNFSAPGCSGTGMPSSARCRLMLAAAECALVSSVVESKTAFVML